MDAVAEARKLVLARFPTVRLALLAGSSARGTATATSDLDIVVVLDGPPAPYRETIRHDGRLVELFVLTADSIRDRWKRDAAERRSSLADMCAHGIVLTGAASELPREAAAFLAAGPPALTPAELDRRRYTLSDALDDLADAVDPDERDVVAGVVLTHAAELALLCERQWLGRGKWLVKRFRALDRPLADRLLAAHRRAVAAGDIADLTLVADEVLARVGGRLTEGYRAS